MSRTGMISMILFAIVLGSSCKSKKGIKAVMNDKSGMAGNMLVQKVRANENTFTYYSARGRAEYKDQSTEQSLGIQIVMEKDRYIWINVTAILGIEAARMLITQDSVVILDRLHRKCIMADYSYIKKMTNADLRLSNLQQIFIGNAPFAPTEATVADTLLSNLILSTVMGPQKQTAFYDGGYKLTRTVLEDQNTKRELKAEYSNPHIAGSNAYPSTININIRAEKNVECVITLNNFAFDKKKDVQFSIPKTYEVVKP